MTKGDIWRAAKIGATYMGAVIGAGFATGQEIIQFFALFGVKGFWGIIIATVMFSLLGTKILLITKQIRGNSYYDFLNYYYGSKATAFVDLVLALVLLVGLGVMLSGSGALFHEHLNWPYPWGVAILVSCTVLILLGGVERLQKINLVLMPLLILFTVILSVTVFQGNPGFSMVQEAIPGPRVASNWLTASMLYVAYNMLLTVVILSSLGNSLKTKVYVTGGILGGMGVGILALLAYFVCLAFMPKVVNYQVPMLYIASHIGPVFQRTYIFIIWIAILTTAIANAYGFAKRVEARTGWPPGLVGTFATLGVIPVAAFEFKDLVRYVYPIFGYLGVIVFLSMIVRPLWSTLIKKGPKPRN